MIAFLGTGLLGSGFARALLRNNHKVRIWNRTYSKVLALQPDGAIPCQSAAEAADNAERIHLALKDDQSVDEVLKSFLSKLKAGTVIIDHTTTSVPGAIKRTNTLREMGITYVHAPVFMGPQNALEGTGYMLVSEAPEIISWVEPLIAPMTGKILNLGAETGKAAALKLIGNSFLVGLTGALADTLSLAGAMNIPVSDVNSLLGEWNPGAPILARIKKITDGRFDKPTWELNMARKDTSLFIESAGKAGITLPVLETMAQLMDKRISNGDGNKDWTIIAAPAAG